MNGRYVPHKPGWPIQFKVLLCGFVALFAIGLIGLVLCLLLW